jgi:membrane protease YdiL (CAAX protease family)
VALVIVLVVVVPVAHEYYFRGVLFSELTRATSRAQGAVVSAFCFAAWHLDPRALPTAFVLGIAMARLRDQTRTVLAPVLGVLAFGAVDGIPWLRGRAPDADITYPMRWVVGGAVMALLALAAIGAVSKSEKADVDEE